MPQLITNALGPDRPGLVGQFTGHLHAAGANVLDSRMVNLRGQFALILLLEAADDAVARLRQSLPGFAEKLDLRVTLTDARPPAAPVKGIPFKLKTYSLDQPGIIHRVSDLLREFGVNIEDLSARQESAPFAGTPLFLMEMRLTIPPKVSITTLRTNLNPLADTLNSDADFEPAYRPVPLPPESPPQPPPHQPHLPLRHPELGRRLRTRLARSKLPPSPKGANHLFSPINSIPRGRGQG